MDAITQVSVRPDLLSLAKRRRQSKCNDHRPLSADFCLSAKAGSNQPIANIKITWR
jgi:hypothetical protein